MPLPLLNNIEIRITGSDQRVTFGRSGKGGKIYEEMSAACGIPTFTI
jgi:hypothetical protein